MHFEQARKLFAESLHEFQHLLTDTFQLIPVGRNKVRVGQFPAQSFSLFDVALVENILSESLDVLRHIPAAVVHDTFLDVLQQPVEHR